MRRSPNAEARNGSSTTLALLFLASLPVLTVSSARADAQVSTGTKAVIGYISSDLEDHPNLPDGMLPTATIANVSREDLEGVSPGLKCPMFTPTTRSGLHDRGW